MIMIQLDRLLLERRMSLTELSDRVRVTMANLSILKTARPAPCASLPWTPFVESWTASRAI